MQVMIVPHVVLVGRALAPIDLVVVGFQLLIHVKGHAAKALAPNGIDDNKYVMLSLW